MAFDTLTPIYPEGGTFPHGENPLSDGGKWRMYSTRPPLQSKADGSALIGTVEFAVNGSYYAALPFQGKVIEAYGCRPESGLGAALESHRIVALFGDPDGYTGYSSGFGGGIGESYFFRLYSGGTSSFVGIGDDGAADGGVGAGGPRPRKLGIRITPDRVQQWGWTSATGWFLVQTHFGTEYRGQCFFALETEEQGGLNEVGWTCFFAQEIRRTQFYRWLPSLTPGELE